MDAAKVKQVIEGAVRTLYQKDGRLIEDRVHEQSIAAKLMSHLQEVLPEWDVDVEYNRQGVRREAKRDTTGVKRKPDIIIHKRGPEGPNVAVILVKCEWNTESRRKDEEAVESIKEAHKYQIGFLLEIKSAGFDLVVV